MLAQRLIAICDKKGCKSICKVTVLMKATQATRGASQPIVLSPTDIRGLPEGWSWGWDGEKTAIECGKHKG